MSYFLDTRQYAERRIRQIEWLLLQRDYKKGEVYGKDPMDATNDIGQQRWKPLMEPTEQDPTEFPSYLDDSHRELIETVAGDVLPEDSRLDVVGITEESLDDLYEVLLNFNWKYPPGHEGFLDWALATQEEAALVGDGLILVRYMPEEKLIRYNFYPAECWDVELDDQTEEPLFYRIEYKVKQVDGKLYWRRFDIWKDRIIYYYDKQVGLTVIDGAKPPDRKSAYLFAQWAGFIAGPMEVKLDTPIEEAAAMREFGGFICVPMVWRWDFYDEDRGVPEMTKPRLAGIDNINRLATGYIAAAIKHGEPSLMTIDLTDPNEAGTEEGEGANKTRGAEGVLNLQSIEDHDGRATYPENAPQALLHKEPLETQRKMVYPNTPDVGLVPGRINRFGELSTAAREMLRGGYDKKIRRLRRRLHSNGILRALSIGARMLSDRSLLPAGVDIKKLKFKFKYGMAELSPDDKVKLMTAWQMLLNAGLDPEELLRQLPIDPQDPEKTLAALSKMLDQRKAQQELLMSAGGLGGQPGKPGAAGARPAGKPAGGGGAPAGK